VNGMISISGKCLHIKKKRQAESSPPDNERSILLGKNVSKKDIVCPAYVIFIILYINALLRFNIV
jgi:hypothetical protein